MSDLMSVFKLTGQWGKYPTPPQFFYGSMSDVMSVFLLDFSLRNATVGISVQESRGRRDLSSRNLTCGGVGRECAPCRGRSRLPGPRRSAGRGRGGRAAVILARS